MSENTSIVSRAPGKAHISLDNVCLHFRKNTDPFRTVKQAVLDTIYRRSYAKRQEFRLFDNLNLEISTGERLGIVGANGAGKSTLLKMISGIYNPTAGAIRIRGRISPLIELGAGFNLELSARENILLNGAFLGYSPREMAGKSDRILDFSELPESSGTPIKYLSTGQLLRLAFSIATDINPEILLIDEIFAAGDVRFVQRAMERMRVLLDTSHIAVIVSHNTQLIQEFCTRAVWLDQGRIIAHGAPADVCSSYIASTTTPHKAQELHVA